MVLHLQILNLAKELLTPSNEFLCMRVSFKVQNRCAVAGGATFLIASGALRFRTRGASFVERQFCRTLDPDLYLGQRPNDRPRLLVW